MLSFGRSLVECWGVSQKVILHDRGEGGVGHKVILHDMGKGGVMQKVILYDKSDLGVNNFSSSSSPLQRVII